jgi:hypothetical protein
VEACFGHLQGINWSDEDPQAKFWIGSLEK